MKQQKSNALSVSAPLHPFLCLSPPPSFPPSVLLLASGRTIKSFPGLSHPMSRMMRICSLNQNSHLLHPPPVSSPLRCFLSHLLPLIYCFLYLSSFLVHSLCHFYFLANSSTTFQLFVSFLPLSSSVAQSYLHCSLFIIFCFFS